MNQEMFGQDNFTVRRTQGNNMFDPESLMSGAEAAQGMTYTNSHRVFPSAEAELDAIHGRINTDEVLRIAPRVLRPTLAASMPVRIAGDQDYGR